MDDSSKHNSSSVFSPALSARERLVAAIEHEMLEARKKMEKRHHWHNVGDLEYEAAWDVQCAMNQLAPDLPEADFVQTMTGHLDRLTRAWRQDDRDEDGYGVGTVHALRRALEGE